MFLQKLFRYLRAPFCQDYRLGLRFRVADPPLLMERVHHVPVQAFPDPSGGPSPVRPEAEEAERRREEERAKKLLQEAKGQAADIVAQAQKRGTEIIDEAKGSARTEGERLITAAQAEIDQEVNRAREQLREKVAALAVLGAEKILRKESNADLHQYSVDALGKVI